MRRLAWVELCVVSLLLGVCGCASADVFGPISLVSSDAFEQVVYAHDPAISGDGRYVAFDGYFDGQTGVWRRDLQTGEIEPVAVGEPETPAGSAELPSISENGQYISFTTLAQLSPYDTNTGPDVYVRDMAQEPFEAGAFTLASAVNGSAEVLTYEYSHRVPLEYEEEHYGAMAPGRSALSASGHEVVFVTTAASDLDGEKTPPLQVAVRYLESKKTELVSVEDDPATGTPVIEDGQTKPVPVVAEGSTIYGAVYHNGEPLPFEPPRPYRLTLQVPVSISSDGSTVAWMGENIGAQARLLPAESVAAKYGEPLWRRIGDGEDTPTRRVTGGSDPANPACLASGEQTLPEAPSPSDPCQGPFAVEYSYGVWGGVEGDIAPQLSKDGYTVAFIANAPLVTLGSDFGVEHEGRHSDLYVADMHEGLTRDQALTPLTELASGDDEDVATNANIVDIAISPNGNDVAFTTKRTVFPLSAPAYVSAPQAVPGLLELFDVDLADDTLTRVTHGYDGGASEEPHKTTDYEDQYEEKVEAGALSPSYSESGDTLAFSSTASNLVYGDGNTPPLNSEGSDGSDAFVVERVVFDDEPAPQVISSAPPSPALTPPWSLGITALSLPNGSVRLYLELPGAGTVSALARGAVVVRSARSARGHASTTVLTRQLTATTPMTTAGAGGFTSLQLTLAPGYRSLAARAGGLSATASVTFAAPGHPALHASIAVVFRGKATKHARAKASARSRARGPKQR